MNNNNLHEAIGSYVKKAVELLGKSSPSKNLSVMDEWMDNFPRYMRQAFRWDTAIGTIEGELSQSLEYKTAIIELVRDPIIQSQLGVQIGTLQFNRLLQKEDCLKMILSSTLTKTNSITFNEGIYDCVYKEMEDFFYTDKFITRFLSPVYGLSIAQNQLQLGDNLKIIRLTDIDKKNFNDSFFGSGSFQNSLTFVDYAFEYKVEESKIIGIKTSEAQVVPPNQVARDHFYHIQSALRLFKKGILRFNVIQRCIQGWQIHGHRFDFVGNPYSIGPYSSYTLGDQEIGKFVVFWHEYNNVKDLNKNEFNLAISRLNVGIERVSLVDKLIDLMIVWEALLLDVGQELRYKLAMRGSRLLGRDAEERKEIWCLLYQAYDQRGKIVHGNSYKDTVNVNGVPIKFNQLVERIEEQTRKLIRAYMILIPAKKKKTINEELDSQIVLG